MPGWRQREWKRATGHIVFVLPNIRLPCTQSKLYSYIYSHTRTHKHNHPPASIYLPSADPHREPDTHYESPLLVQRCNSTTAGLGYFGSKCGLSMQISPWMIGSVQTVNTHWGEWHNPTADINLKHNLVNTAPQQTNLKSIASTHHHATHKQK